MAEFAANCGRCRRYRAHAHGPGRDGRVVGPNWVPMTTCQSPSEPRELLARLRAILRRATGDAARNTGRARCTSLWRARHRPCCTSRDERWECALTGHHSLLLTLAENAGRVLSRDQLMRLTKGEELEAFDRSIDVPSRAFAR